MAIRKDLANHLRHEEPLPVYAILSEDAFLRSEAISHMRSKLLTAAPDFNRDELKANDGASRIVQAAKTLPMMAPKRWVHVSDIHKLSAKESPALINYIESPSQATTLCLSGDKLDSRKKLGKTLSKLGFTFILEPPKPRDLPAWLHKRARHHSYILHDDAAGLICDLIGADLGTLDNTLHKLQAFVGTDQPIECEAVEQCVAATRVHSIFELTDAIGHRDLGRASQLVRNALDGGESGLMILAMVARQVRQLIQVHALETRGVNAPDMAQQLKVRPFLVDGLTQQAKRYSQPELCRALAAVGRADLAMKSSRLAHGVILDRLLVEMAYGGMRA